MRKHLLIGAGLALFVVAPAISQDIRNTYVSLAAQVADGILTNAKLANMANSTVKCRTTAGTGVPEDCTAAQAAAIIGSVGGALKSHVIIPTRDLTVASGSVAYTGCGFQPTALVGTGTVNSSATLVYTTYIGVAGSDKGSASLNGAAAASEADGSFLSFYDATGANRQVATISSYDADGFTLSWTKTGTPTGTAQLIVLCLR